MTEKLELYKCNICGNMVQVLIEGAGELYCCGEPMELLSAQVDDNRDGLGEKHTPEIEVYEDKKCITLKKHPMQKEHYIQFIEAYPKDKSKLYIKFLEPNEKPELDITHFEENIVALEHCNIHGLWKNRDE